MQCKIVARVEALFTLDKFFRTEKRGKLFDVA